MFSDYLRQEQVCAAKGRRRAVLRASHRRTAARRAARVLHARRVPLGNALGQCGADGPEQKLPGDRARVSTHDADHPHGRAPASRRFGADVLRRSRGPLGRRHAGGGDDQFQTLGARRLLLYGSQRVPHAQRGSTYHRAHQVEGCLHRFLPADYRRPQDLRRRMDPGLRDEGSPGLGQNGAVRVHLRREQPLPRREVQRAVDKSARRPEACVTPVMNDMIRGMYRIVAVIVLASGAAAAQDVQKCAALTGAKSSPNPTTTIKSASLNPASAAQGRTPALPEHCEVMGQMNDRVGVNSQHYAIKFHLRLPTAWNGRFFFEGGGGSNGALGNALGNLQGQQRTNALTLGYAVVSQDSGHDNAVNNDPNRGGTTTFGFDPQARLDFGYNSYDQVTQAAKALIQIYYGRA